MQFKGFSMRICMNIHYYPRHTWYKVQENIKVNLVSKQAQITNLQRLRSWRSENYTWVTYLIEVMQGCWEKKDRLQLRVDLNEQDNSQARISHPDLVTQRLSAFFTRGCLSLFLLFPHSYFEHPKKDAGINQRERAREVETFNSASSSSPSLQVFKCVPINSILYLWI